MSIVAIDPTVTVTDLCPKCATTPIEIRLHGVTAGVTEDGDFWQCTRCGLLAVDLDNATEYAEMTTPIGRPGRLLDRLLRDAEQGRPVDPMQLARAQGAAWNDQSIDRQLCEIAWIVWSGIAPKSPWSVEPAATVAEMFLAALHAGQIDLIDALDPMLVDDEPPEVPELDRAERDDLAAQVVEHFADGGLGYAETLGRRSAFGFVHGSRDDAAVAIFAAIVEELRGDRCLLGQFDSEVAASIRTALAAGGFQLWKRGVR